jgi:hypothetical protein
MFLFPFNEKVSSRFRKTCVDYRKEEAGNCRGLKKGSLGKVARAFALLLTATYSLNGLRDRGSECRDPESKIEPLSLPAQEVPVILNWHIRFPPP